MILVTGGTGFVGQEVVRKLLALGYKVRLLVRDPRRAATLAHHPEVEIVQGDVLRPETLPAAMTGVKAVIHLIGIIAETSKITFEQGHVEATRNVLAAAKQAGVTRWVQMSAAGTRPNASSRYHITKWQAEELVRQSGLDWTVFRPSLIYGYNHEDKILNLLKLALSWPLNVVTCYSLPLLNGGKPLVQPVSVREVAHCFAHAASNKTSIGQTFDLVGPVAFSWREMATKIATALGLSFRYENVPVLLVLRALLWLATVLFPIWIIVSVVQHHLNLVEAELALGFAVVLAALTSLWRKVIIFNLPAAPLLLIGQILNSFAPRALQMSEQLKMAIEDNAGDPKPAAETFGYVPESFEAGVARVVGA